MNEPANAAVNMEYIFYLAPNKSAYDLVSGEFKENDALYNKTWDKIQAAQ